MIKWHGDRRLGEHVWKERDVCTFTPAGLCKLLWLPSLGSEGLICTRNACPDTTTHTGTNTSIIACYHKFCHFFRVPTRSHAWTLTLGITESHWPITTVRRVLQDNTSSGSNFDCTNYQSHFLICSATTHASRKVVAPDIPPWSSLWTPSYPARTLSSLPPPPS